MLRILIFSAIAVAATSCSDGSPSAPAPVASTPPVTPPLALSGSPTITITAAGMSPLELTVAIGQRVTFVNNDSRAHDVMGGKDPATPDCPEITAGRLLGS